MPSIKSVARASRNRAHASCAPRTPRPSSRGLQRRARFRKAQAVKCAPRTDHPPVPLEGGSGGGPPWPPPGAKAGRWRCARVLFPPSASACARSHCASLRCSFRARPPRSHPQPKQKREQKKKQNRTPKKESSLRLRREHRTVLGLSRANASRAARDPGQACDSVRARSRRPRSREHSAKQKGEQHET